METCSTPDPNHFWTRALAGGVPTIPTIVISRRFSRNFLSYSSTCLPHIAFSSAPPPNLTTHREPRWSNHWVHHPPQHQGRSRISHTHQLVLLSAIDIPIANNHVIQSCVIMRSCHCCNRNTAWGNIGLVFNRTCGVSVAGVARRLRSRELRVGPDQSLQFPLGGRFGDWVPVASRVLCPCLAFCTGPWYDFPSRDTFGIPVVFLYTHQSFLFLHGSVRAFFAIVPNKASEPVRFSNRVSISQACTRVLAAVSSEASMASLWGVDARVLTILLMGAWSVTIASNPDVFIRW
ncbi:hypothetical protein SeMB42_g06978 [Synchytrium endobioticum]|uniref:Uncharacterized protein n=1 Tax=Synchytrium endobioticum TaxID=286115 RepID=A0A507CDJ8_9FUNG|nr:hypothetical protein SeMB42_g06978 [Synchytrium endobioticum]